MPHDPKKVPPRTLPVPSLRASHPLTAPNAPTANASPATVTAAAPEGARTAKNPLSRFSLRGRADEFEANSADTKPLLGKFVMQGQQTMIYAAPNTGKTLIALKLCLDAIHAARIDPANLYYVNADDGSAGLATKLRLLDDVGAHTLAPGFGGMKSKDLESLLIEAAEGGWARGTCVVIDTLKKFTDLMHKSRSSEFADVCRRYTAAAGTIVALGHTRKAPDTNGKPQYQGTTDILEDFDAVYLAEPLSSQARRDVRVAKFTRIKCRAANPETVAYAYAADSKVPYLEKLASVRPVDPSDLDDYTVESDNVSDPAVMAAFVRLIQEEGRDLGQMDLARAAAAECGVSQRAALSVLSRYTGTEPNKHLWTFSTGLHNRRTFRLIDQSKPSL